MYLWHILAQTTQSTPNSISITDLIKSLVETLGTIASLVIAIKSWWNSRHNSVAIKNLAQATTDVATTYNGSPQANLTAPSTTISKLEHIAYGGNGQV